MHRFFLTVCLLTVYILSFSQSDVTGLWKTIDDETGKAKSVVSIYEKDHKIYGKIIKLFREAEEDPDPVCSLCPEDDPRFNQKIIGMEIITGLKKDGNEYSGGTVLKADEGDIYRCKIWLEDSKLKVRGYLGFFFRTQTWVKYSE